MKKRLISMLLVIVMLVSMMPALGITINAATPTTDEGMTFTADKLYKIPYKLNLDKPTDGSDEAITIEAEIFIPYSDTSARKGCIVSTYKAGGTDMGFEIHANGIIRYFNSHIKDIRFNANIFDYMGGETEAKFAKVACVENITKKTVDLYINGNHVQTVALGDKAVSGSLKLTEYFYLGGDLRSGNSQYFKGNIKNITLYSDVRTADELLASGTATSYSVDATDDNLLFAYDLTKDDPFKDLSGNGYHIIDPDSGPQAYEGMTFTADKMFKIPYKLNVPKPASGAEAITFEAEIFVPYGQSAGRNGVIIGTYTDDSTKYGNIAGDMNFEVHKNGVMRFYTKHMDNIMFDDYNIFDDMGGETEAKFAKVACVINVTDKTAKLYVNGALKSTKALSSSSASGEFFTTQNFYLGGDLRTGNTEYFKGNIKNVTLYSDVRTDAELLASGTSTTYSVDNTDANLIFAYDLSDGTNAGTKDLSKNGYSAEYLISGGKTFVAEDCNEISKPFAQVPKTVEATIHLPRTFSKRGTIISNYDNGRTNGNYFAVEVSADGKPRFYYSTGANGSYSAMSWFANVDLREYNDWVHLTLVYDDTADASKPTLRCYVNGEEKATTQGSVYSDLLSGAFKYAHRIGRDYRTQSDNSVLKPAGADDLFNGRIKDIAIYTDARSAAEIKGDYENGANTADANILAAYDFTKAADFKDFSGNGYDIKRQGDEGLSFTQNELYRTEGKLSAVPHSFETWLYLPTTVTGRAGVIFGNNHGAGKGKDSDLSIEIVDNGVPRLYYRGSDKYYDIQFASADIRSDNWVHLAITHDPTTGEAKCYVNGELKQSIVGGAYHSTAAQNLDGYGLGGDMRNYTDNNPSSFNSVYFKGSLLDLAIYSDVRTAEEIKAAYEDGISLSDNGLISYYDLGSVEDGATQITDAKGKNNVTTDWKLFSGIDKSDYEYSFAFIGDTQKIVYTDAKNALDANKADTDYTKQIYQWIADNKDNEKIKYVFGLGDITELGAHVNNESNAAQAKKEWDIAYNAMDPLRVANVNYALIAGNHENPWVLTDYFGSDTFMTDKISGYYSTGGNKLGNYYVNFEVGETKYMFIALQFGAPDAILNWASDVVEANPDRKVIVATHCYMFNDGTRLDQGDLAAPSESDNNGDEIWEKFASQHANIVLVVSGHDPYENISWRQDIGVNGNTVSQFLIDPQGMSPTTTGMVALFHFSADGSQVAVEYVSTHRTNTTGTNIYYRTQNQFEFNLYEGAKENVYHVTGDADNYTAYYTNGKVTSFNAANTLATVNGYKLSLEGNIGVKSFMNIPVFTNTDKLYAKFIVDGEEYVQYFKDAENNATYGYGFKGLVSAAQMTSEIKIELYYDEILLVSDTTSVAKYAEVILVNSDNNADYTKAQGIVKAMLNYGAAAQVEFGQNLDKPANSIVTDVTVGNNKDAINAAAKSKVSGTVDGVTYKSTTLGLESETALYHFFTVTDKDINNYTVTEGVEAVIIGNTLRVKIAGIEAANLSSEYAVSVTYGENTKNTITVSANAMAYAKAVVNSDATSAELKTLMNALYAYNVAMVEYNG